MKRIKFIKGLAVTEISGEEDLKKELAIAATKNTESYILFNLTDAASTDPRNPPPGFMLEVKPVKETQKLVVSYFRVPQAYVMPDNLQKVITEALQGGQV
jgi:hypothetical protein